MPALAEHQPPDAAVALRRIFSSSGSRSGHNRLGSGGASSGGNGSVVGALGGTEDDEDDEDDGSGSSSSFGTGGGGGVVPAGGMGRRGLGGAAGKVAFIRGVLQALLQVEAGEAAAAASLTAQVVGRFSGGPSSFRPVLVHGDQFCYRFRPVLVHGGLPERQRRGPRLGLPLQRGAVQNFKVFTALVRYLRSGGVPYKHRAVALLTRLRSTCCANSATAPPRRRPRRPGRGAGRRVAAAAAAGACGARGYGANGRARTASRARRLDRGRRPRSRRVCRPRASGLDRTVAARGARNDLPPPLVAEGDLLALRRGSLSGEVRFAGARELHVRLLAAGWAARTASGGTLFCWTTKRAC